MTKRVIMMFGALWVGLLLRSLGVNAAPPSSMQIVTGTCAGSSHTAEGPLGSDLTKRQSRLFCDSAVLTYFDDYKGHVLIQFAQTKTHSAPILGFSGRVENDGIMMSVDHVYLAEGQSTTVSDGSCKFFFQNRHMSGIFCGMVVDAAGRRKTAVVVFDVATVQ